MTQGMSSEETMRRTLLEKLRKVCRKHSLRADCATDIAN